MIRSQLKEIFEGKDFDALLEFFTLENAVTLYEERLQEKRNEEARAALKKAFGKDATDEKIESVMNKRK